MITEAIVAGEKGEAWYTSRPLKCSAPTLVERTWKLGKSNAPSSSIFTISRSFVLPTSQLRPDNSPISTCSNSDEICCAKPDGRPTKWFVWSESLLFTDALLALRVWVVSEPLLFFDVRNLWGALWAGILKSPSVDARALAPTCIPELSGCWTAEGLDGACDWPGFVSAGAAIMVLSRTSSRPGVWGEEDGELFEFGLLVLAGHLLIIGTGGDFTGPLGK